MPQTDRPRRVSIRLPDANHTAWTISAQEEGVSLEEFVRRAGDERSIGQAPAFDHDGEGARILRALIEHYQELLAVIERNDERDP